MWPHGPHEDDSGDVESRTDSETLHLSGLLLCSGNVSIRDQARVSSEGAGGLICHVDKPTPDQTWLCPPQRSVWVLPLNRLKGVYGLTADGVAADQSCHARERESSSR